MTLSQRAGGALTFLWRGPEGLTPALQLEWRLVAVRWIGLFFMGPGILLAHLPIQSLWAAGAVLVFAVVYNLLVQHWIRTRPSVFANGYLTVIGDTLLTIAMIKIGGGFGSPFYYLLFTVTIAAAMRYGYGPSLATVLIVIFLDTVETTEAGSAFDVTFVVRSGFLLITALLAGYLREQARHAERALQERLSQASLLNEATITLGASLEFESALRAVAEAACQLFGARCAALRTTPSLDRAQEPSLAVAYHPLLAAEPAGGEAELIALCDEAARAGEAADAPPRTVARHTLADGDRALTLALALPLRHTTLATLALRLAPDRTVRKLDRDILEAFVERTTLAIESASLYRALTSRTNDLQRAYGDLALAHQELLGVDEMKTNFLANVSHELRTPLTSIRSFSELLLSYDNPPEVQTEFLQIINSESERLTRLVNDVLDITKIEAGRMDLQLVPIDLTALLGECARSYATLIAECGLGFRQQIDLDLPVVLADRDRLQQVIANILNNAMKFTAAGVVTLAARRVGGEVQVAISDTGIGIAPEDQARIFEKFQQVGDTLTEKPRGTGLGLCICRDIVAYHQGRLWVESELGSGSTFTFALPALLDKAEPSEEAYPLRTLAIA